MAGLISCCWPRLARRAVNTAQEPTGGKRTSQPYLRACFEVDIKCHGECQQALESWGWAGWLACKLAGGTCCRTGLTSTPPPSPTPQVAARGSLSLSGAFIRGTADEQRQQHIPEAQAPPPAQAQQSLSVDLPALRPVSNVPNASPFWPWTLTQDEQAGGPGHKGSDMTTHSDDHVTFAATAAPDMAEPEHGQAAMASQREHAHVAMTAPHLASATLSTVPSLLGLLGNALEPILEVGPAPCC